MDKTIFFGKDVKFDQAQHSGAFMKFLKDKKLTGILNKPNERREVYKDIQGYVQRKGKFTEDDARHLIGDLARNVSAGKGSINRQELHEIQEGMGVHHIEYSKRPVADNVKNMPVGLDKGTLNNSARNNGQKSTPNNSRVRLAI